MNEISTNLHTQTSPTQAIEEYMGEQYIEWLNNYIPAEMESWGALVKIRTNTVKPEKIKKILLQVFLTDEAFLGGREGDPGFLRFAIANLSESDDPLAETALEILEKRRIDELAGHKVERGILQTHKREQWIRLLKALGVTEDEMDKAEPKEPTRNYIAELSEVYSTGEWQTAMGAYASQERSSVELYRAVLNLLKNNAQVSEKEIEVLSSYVNSASQHGTGSSHVLDKVVFDREAKELVWQGVSRHLEVLKDFLTGLEKYLE